METNPTSEALVRAVVDLANSLDVATVAEGIENADQKAQLARIGCTYGQGYLFAEAEAGRRDRRAARAPSPGRSRPAAPRRSTSRCSTGSTGSATWSRSSASSTTSSRCRSWPARGGWRRGRPSTTTGPPRRSSCASAIAAGSRPRRCSPTGWTASRPRWSRWVTAPSACTRFPSRSERAVELLARGIKDVLDDFGAWTLQSAAPRGRPGGQAPRTAAPERPDHAGPVGAADRVR